MAEPIIGMRFSVLFLAGGVVPNPLDIRFQKVSGLSATVDTMTVEEGGQNLYKQKLPTGISYNNLTLERGMVVGSPLNLEFNAAMSLFKFATSNVLVTLLGESKLPLAAWLFLKAYPVKWSTSDLSAEPALVIDTMELAYTRMQVMRICTDASGKQGAGDPHGGARAHRRGGRRGRARGRERSRGGGARGEHRGGGAGVRAPGDAHPRGEAGALRWGCSTSSSWRS